MAKGKSPHEFYKNKNEEQEPIINEVYTELYHEEARQPDEEMAPPGEDKDYPASIVLEKKIYGSKRLKENTDLGFRELDHKEYSIEEFFKLYKQLFTSLIKS